MQSPHEFKREQAMQTISTAQERRPVGAAAYIAAKSLAPASLPGQRRVPSAATHMLFGSPELAGIAMTYDRNSEIYGEGEAADYVYKVDSGASLRSERRSLLIRRLYSRLSSVHSHHAPRLRNFVNA